MKRKMVITGLTCMFLLVSGICYSCSYQKEQSELNAADAVDLEAGDPEIEGQEGLILSDSETKEDNQPSISVVPEEEYEAAGVIYVHVCGAVFHPGVYEADESARVVDALELAGGLTKDAAGDYLNQAQPITDGQRIYVPTEAELDNLTADEIVSGEGAAVEETKDNKDTSLVNINTADAAKLMTLPGIGQSKANSIIEYRNANGSFKVIEDLMKVTGIKEGSFGQISDKISVN